MMDPIIISQAEFTALWEVAFVGGLLGYCAGGVVHAVSLVALRRLDRLLNSRVEKVSR